MLTTKLMKIVLLTIFVLFACIKGQNISGINCFNATNGQYLCNNQGYQGFSYNTSTNANVYTINCLGGANNCWYQINSTNPSINQYVFCNYTFASCSLCSNVSCTTCYNGYYTYTFQILNNYANCQLCSQAIPGCSICQSQGSCSQCTLPYINYDGQCFTQSGDPVSGFNPFSSGGSTAAQIVMDCFIFLILVAVAYAFFYLFVCKKNPNANSNSNSGQNQNQNYNQKQPAKIVSYDAPQRTSEMREPHEMRRDSLNKNIVKQPMSTRNAQHQQHPIEASIRDELIVVDQTERGLSNV